MKCTIASGLPSENIWGALIVLDCLQPGFEVGHQGGLPDPISQAEVNCTVQLTIRGIPPPLLFPPFYPPGIISLHHSSRLSLSSHHLFPVIPLSGLSSALAHAQVSLSALCISAPSPLSPSLSLSTYEVYTMLCALCCCSPRNYSFLPDSVLFHAILFQCTAGPTPSHSAAAGSLFHIMMEY